MKSVQRMSATRTGQEARFARLTASANTLFARYPFCLTAYSLSISSLVASVIPNPFSKISLLRYALVTPFCSETS